MAIYFTLSVFFSFSGSAMCVLPCSLRFAIAGILALAVCDADDLLGNIWDYEIMQPIFDAEDMGESRRGNKKLTDPVPYHMYYARDILA